LRGGEWRFKEELELKERMEKERLFMVMKE